MARKSSTKPVVILKTLEDSVSTLDQSTLAAYLATDYWVAWPDKTGTVLKIGSPNTAFMERLAEQGVSSFAIVTAYNPGSVLTSDEENQRRHAQLLEMVNQSGLEWCPSCNRIADGSWPEEPGFMVINISRQAALSLGRAFGQHALVWWSAI